MRHHPFFIGWDDQHVDTAGSRTDVQIVAGIRFRIEQDAEPLGLQADAAPNLGSVLADAAGEHQCIETSGRSSQRTEFAGDAVAEQVDGLY